MIQHCPDIPGHAYVIIRLCGEKADGKGSHPVISKNLQDTSVKNKFHLRGMMQEPGGTVQAVGFFAVILLEGSLPGAAPVYYDFVFRNCDFHRFAGVVCQGDAFCVGALAA